MRVNIVCYEDPDRWILGKFARKLHEHLDALGVVPSLSRTPDSSADINHHIIYLDYNGQSHGIDTLMVTHVDTAGKLRQLKRQMHNAALAICMSSSTVQQLEKAGLSSKKLCYVLPARNEAISLRKITVGLSTRVYQDGRKREWMLLKIAEEVKPEYFRFKIIGEGWDGIIRQLRGEGFEVEYAAGFDQESYALMMKSLDYYLYPGEDEGAMGVIDALGAGVPVISTPQGYHLDIPGGLPFIFRTERELAEIFKKISADKEQLIASVADWTWKDYACKHIQLWEHLLGAPQSQLTEYKDGLASLGACSVLNANWKSRAEVNSKVALGSLGNWWGRLKSVFRPGGVKY